MVSRFTCIISPCIPTLSVEMESQSPFSMLKVRLYPGVLVVGQEFLEEFCHGGVHSRFDVSYTLSFAFFENVISRFYMFTTVCANCVQRVSDGRQWPLFILTNWKEKSSQIIFAARTRCHTYLQVLEAFIMHFQSMEMFSIASG